MVTSKLFEAAKRGNIPAMIFWLKAWAGWRDSDPIGSGGVSVNVNTGQVGEDPVEAEKKRAAKRRELLLLLTIDGRRLYLKLLRVAAERQQEMMAAKTKQPEPAQVPVTIQTTATAVAKTQERTNSPEMPIPGAPFVGAKWRSP